MKKSKLNLVCALALVLQPGMAIADGCKAGEPGCYKDSVKKRTVESAAKQEKEVLVAQQYDNNKFYATIGAGWRAIEKDEEILGHMIFDLKFGAFRFQPNWSAEIGVGYAPDVRNREYPSGSGGLDKNTTYTRFTADALYHLQEQESVENFDPYLAFGGGINLYEDELSSGNDDWFWGGGFGSFINLDESFFLKPDYRLHDTKGDLSQEVTLALGVKFCL